MHAGAILREARTRAGLTQLELARRAGTTQSAVSRLERGRLDPTLATLERLVQACGQDLVVRLASPGANDPDLESSLRMTPEARLAQLTRAVAFIQAGRRAMEVVRD